MAARGNGKSRTEWNQAMESIEEADAGRQKVQSTVSFFLPMKDIPTVTHQEKEIAVRQKNIRRSDGRVVKKPVPVVYEGEKLKDARALFMGMLQRRAPAVPFEGPVRLITKWIWNNGGGAGAEREAEVKAGTGAGTRSRTVAEAMPKTGRKDGRTGSGAKTRAREVPGHRDGEWKTTKPDTDNMIKLLKDCMTRTGFWVDDAQVCSEITEKFWGDVSGIYVMVEQLEQEQ